MHNLIIRIKRNFVKGTRLAINKELGYSYMYNKGTLVRTNRWGT